MRPSHADPDQLRDLRLTRGYTRHAEGSVLVELGDTRVLCNASVEERVPGFLRGQGRGWITAEYGMLPALHPYPQRPRGGPRQAGWAYPGDPAPDRSLAARLRRPGGPGGAHHHPGLRRAPGRRRDPYRLHHRGLGRPARCGAGIARRGEPHRRPDPHPGRGGLRRGLPGGGGPRSRLCGGLHRTDRHERGHGCRRGLDRGPGDRRGDPVLPRRARRHARPGLRRDRDHDGGAAPRPGWPVDTGPAVRAPIETDHSSGTRP